MHRNTSALTEYTFDVAIVGGGIYGAALVREAALRGLRAALIERGDFCCATSANSLKIIHGGLRYLQQADILRVLESVRERRAFMRIAPHLVHPQPCLMPTKGITKSKPAMFAGLLANDLLSWDRNRGIDADHLIPRGRIASRHTLEQLLPGYDGPGSGAAIWTDGVADDTERIVVEMINSSAEAGACVANYVDCSGFIMKNGQVTGIKARDSLTNENFVIQARLVINAAGPWCNDLLNSIPDNITPLPYALALGMNAILKNNIYPTHAAGLPCREPGPDRGRLMFFVPWQGTTMAGTYYRHYIESAASLVPTNADNEHLLQQLNSAIPGINLTLDDVARTHAGLLPCIPGRPADSDPKLLRHYMLVDHTQRDGIDGLLTVLGVKYTTARDVAERTITLAANKLNIPIRPSSSSISPLTPGSRDIACAINQEMAQTLSDVIYRRTGLGSAAIPTREDLCSFGKQMGSILGWDEERIAANISNAASPSFSA